jgi:hypothetical protein
VIAEVPHEGGKVSGAAGRFVEPDAPHGLSLFQKLAYDDFDRRQALPSPETALNLSFCKEAVAYLMPSLPDAEPTIELAGLDAPVITDLNNGLLVGYLVDQGDYFRYVQQRHLVAAGLTEAELHRRAVENLAVLLDANAPKIQPCDEAFLILFGGNFEASLILLDALWDKHLNHLAPNGFVITIPSRDILAFCDAESSSGVEELRQIITRVEGGDHPIISTLYRRNAVTRTWRPYAN